MTQRSRLQPLRFFKACARMAAFCAVCVGAAGLLWVHSARSQAAEGSLQFGRQLAGLGALQGRVTNLRVNGNDVLAGGHFLDLELGEVLDRFQKACSEQSWKMGELSGDLAGVVPADAPLTLTSARSEDEGVVVCLSPSQSGSGLSAFLTHAKAAVDSGELGRLGQFHYLYARKNPGGGTSVIGVWTAATFNVHTFFAQNAEATGDDNPDIPRVPGSHRTLQVELVGSAYAMRQYGTPRSPADAALFYSQVMPARGWKAIATGAKAGEIEHVTFEKKGAIVLVAASKVVDETRVSLLEMGAAPDVTVEVER